MPTIFNRTLFASPALLVVAWGGLPLVSMAQANVSVPIEIEHSSNPELTTDEAIGVTRFRVSPQYTLVGRDGSTQTRLTLGGVLERSSNTSVSNHRSDPNLSYEIELAFPVGSLGLRASLSESSTRAEEFAETGVVASDATQRDIVLDGTWRREVSDVSRVELGLGATKVRYDTPSLVGYREVRSSVGGSYDLVAETQLTARWEGSRLQPDQGTDRSSRRSIAVGLATRLSEAFRFVAEKGTVRTSGLGATRTPSTLLRLEYAGERMTSTFEWSRSTAISGSLAEYISTRQFGWTVGYEFSESTSINLSASQARSQGEGGASGSTWMAGLRHSINDFWFIEGRLGQLQTRPNAGGKATANVAGLILTYSHPDF